MNSSVIPKSIDELLADMDCTSADVRGNNFVPSQRSPIDILDLDQSQERFSGLGSMERKNSDSLEELLGGPTPTYDQPNSAVLGNQQVLLPRYGGIVGMEEHPSNFSSCKAWPCNYPLQNGPSPMNEQPLPPQQHTDILVQAVECAGIQFGHLQTFESSALPSTSAGTGDHSLLRQSPRIWFDIQPDDVQFRYEKEIVKCNTSPIHGKNGEKCPVIKVSNIRADLQYEVRVTLVDDSHQPTQFQLYRTKEEKVPRDAAEVGGGNRKNIDSFTRKITLLTESEIPVENVGIMRPVVRGGDGGSVRSRRGSIGNCARLQAQLYIISTDEECLDTAVSEPIHDLKKSSLKIVHLNPAVAFCSGKQEVTILCTKVREDTEVYFSIDDWEEKANINLRHHGVAIVALAPNVPPEIMRNRDCVEAKVTLRSASLNRQSEAIKFIYKEDHLLMLQPMSPPRARSRSPLRGGGPSPRLEPDSSPRQDEDAVQGGPVMPLVRNLMNMKLEDEESGHGFDPEYKTKASQQPSSRIPLTPAQCPRSRKSLSKMADLKKIREIARGERPWTEEDKENLIQSPFVLHVQDKSGKTPLMEALVRGRETIFRKFLDAIDADHRRQLLSLPAPNGVTLLHMLAVHTTASVALLQYMLDNGSDPRVADKNGQTLVHWLVRRGRVSLLEEALVTIRRWMKTEKQGEDGFAALLNRTDNDGRCALHLAAIFRVPAAIHVLVSSGANADLVCPHNGYTALHWAVVEADGTAVDELLKVGAKPLIRTKWGATPAHMADTSSIEGQQIAQRLKLKMGLSKSSSEESES